MINDGYLVLNFIYDQLKNIYNLFIFHWSLGVIIIVVLLGYVIQLIRSVYNKD